jgi:murein L,D-transpeptidase YafK
MRRAVLFALWLTACAAKPPAAPPAVPPAPPPPPCERVLHLAVQKSEHALLADCEGGASIRFPVALSREKGAKRANGDQRVPEGDYQIAGPARESRFHRFLPIDYPSRDDAARALAEGRIGRREHDAIVRAHRAHRLPPQHTALGGGLGLHGEGERWKGDLRLDWTDGCIAVTDTAIDWLVEHAPPGTPISIAP